MRDGKMTPHKPSPMFTALASATLLAAFAAFTACGGGDESTFQAGRLTDPGNVPTASPWEEVPAVTILDPNALTPLNPTPAPTEEGDGVEPGVCGPQYTIASGDSFSTVADKCGFTTQQVVDANPGVDPKTLRVGQVINLPAEPSP